MMSLNYILKNSKVAYKFTKLQDSPPNVRGRRQSVCKN